MSSEYVHYTSEERNDADAVERAADLLRQKDLVRSRALLEPIALRTPAVYVYSYETGKELYVKFWDLGEYLGFMSLLRKPGGPAIDPDLEVIWLKAAYPRALFLLAKVELAQGNLGIAAERLDEALRLEPDHPECLCLLADICTIGRDWKLALALYEQTLHSRPYLNGATLQRAQEGKAKALERMGKYKEAGPAYAQAMGANPAEAVVRNLERYQAALEVKDINAPLAIKVDPEVLLGQDDVLLKRNPDAAWGAPGRRAGEAAPAPTADAEAQALPAALGDEVQTEQPEAAAPVKVRKWWQVWR